MRRFFERKLRGRHVARDVSESDNEASGVTASQKQNLSVAKTFPAGIKVLYASESSIVDIVFIHGLTGDRERTWTMEKEEPWPGTLLPAELPEIRVLTFGYDAYVVDLGGVVSKNLIANHAMNLITALASYREKDDTNGRPIVFVCHSLGGLVCQDALIHARQRPESHLNQIYLCSRGILFLGTPHRGAGLAKWGEMLARTLGLIKQTNSGILEVLMRDSEVLARVQDAFFTMVRSRDKEHLPPIEITCFFEELPLPGIGVVVPRESAAIPGYIPISIRQNHMDMTKFAHAGDPGFSAVAGELRRWVRQIQEPEAVPKVASSPRSLTISERDFLAMIGPRRYIHIEDRVQGTCTWSVETAQYHSWLYGEQSSILWVTGSAGSGKTTLANYLVEHLKNQPNARSNCQIENVVCSFFCSRDVEGQHDIRSLLQDLVLQIAEPRKKLISQMKTMFGAGKREHDSSIENIWRMFEKVLLTLPYHCIYITIDALDECDEGLRSRLFQKIARTVSSMASTQVGSFKKVKLIISGQPQIRASWTYASEYIEHHHINIEDRPMGMMRDIDLFVNTRVTELVEANFCSQSVGEYLKGALGSMAENSFLWLDVVLKHIKSCLRYRLEDLKRILSDVPRDLQQAYTRYLPVVVPSEESILRVYLQLLVASSRPLSLKEVDALAAACEEVPGATITTAIDDEVVKASMQRALGPLVKFPNRTAQFIHSTAKEFFILIAREREHPLKNSHGTDVAEAHSFCTRSCMTYLLGQAIPVNLFNAERLSPASSEIDSPVSARQYANDEDMLANLFDLGEVRFLRDEESLGKDISVNVQQEFSAYDYAANNWTYHFTRSETLLDEEVVSKALDLLSCTPGRFSDWYKYRAYQSHLLVPSSNELSPIVLASMFDLTTLVRILLDDPEYLKTPQMLFSALFWGASRGSCGPVNLLLKHGVPASSKDAQKVPLAIATRGNFEEICDLLLGANDVDPNELDDHGKPALVLAAEADHAQVLRRLLRHKSVQVDQVDTEGRTALMAAARNGSETCVQILREVCPANVNDADYKGQTALHHASYAGHVRTLKELLAFSTLDVHAKDHCGRNALSLASQQGHLHVVKLLHRRNVDAASIDVTGRNAISWAANSLKATTYTESSKESVLEYLVRKFPLAIDVPDEHGWTPLAWALDTPGYLRSVQILSNSPDVDVNRRDTTSGRPLLAWAASSGMTDIMRCLLRRPEIDPNAKSFSGQTPLSYAAANGMMDAVRLILQDKNVVINQVDKHGRSPADWAEINAHSQIAGLLRTFIQS